MSKYIFTDTMNKVTFKSLGKGGVTGIIGGRINKITSDKAIAWLGAHRQNRSKCLLLIDSVGGVADRKLLDLILQTDVHVHILEHAGSWAGILALCAGNLTANPGSTLMVHEAKWKGLKESESMTEISKILEEHNYIVKNVLKSVLPDGIMKNMILEAKIGDGDTHFECEDLHKAGIISDICNVDLTGLASVENARIIEGLFNGKK